MRRAPVANAGQSELMTSSFGSRGKITSAVATPSSATVPRQRQRSLTLEVDAQAVVGGAHVDSRPLGDAGRDLLRVLAPYRHPEVGEEGGAWSRRADDPLRVVDAQVRQLRPAVEKDGVHEHDARPVLLGDTVVVSGVGDPPKPVAEAEAVRLDLVDVTPARGELDAVDGVRGLGGETHDLARKTAHVPEHDGIVVERVRGTEQ